MKNPENLKYTKSHEWALFTGENSAKVGLTEYAQETMGSLVFVNLPEEGDAVCAGESFGDVESVKAVSDVISPFSGVISAINEELMDTPEKINDDPYGSWLVEITDINGQVELLDAGAYEELCRKGE